MPDYSHLIDKTFGLWTVTGPSETRRYYVACVCACGSLREVAVGQLTNGYARSCGCLARLPESERAKFPPKYPSEYKIWKGMRSRCLLKNDSHYPSYGGRGIRICDRWSSYEAFLQDVGRRPSPRHTLDRIDNDGDYEPGNVRWATAKEQNRNTRRSRKIVRSDGVRFSSFAEAAEVTGEPWRAIHWAVRSGKPCGGHTWQDDTP